MTVDERPTVHCLDALRELRTQRRGAGGAFVPTQPQGDDDDDPFAGPKLITDPAAFVTTALGRNLAELAAMGERSGRNAAAHALGRSVGMWAAGGLPVDVTDALERIIGAADANGLVGEDGLRSVRESVKSGYQWGLEHPYAWQQAPRGVASPVDVDLASPPALPLDDDALLSAEVRAQRIKREARRFLDIEESARSWRPPTSHGSLTEELTLPDDPVLYVVDKVLPVGTNATLTAPAKTGKTTAVNNLIGTLVDGSPFLDKFKLATDVRSVAVLNFEVDERTYRRWLREAGIRNTGAVHVLHLRGGSLPLDHPAARRWFVEWLGEREIGVVILDPFARAYKGDENDNGAVGEWLDNLDMIKAESGVGELIMPVHTGRGSTERSRGAQRLDDWPDALWKLTRDEDDYRYFAVPDTRADEPVPEFRLKYDTETRRLSYAGPGRKRSATNAKVETAYRELPRWGEQGISQNELGRRMESKDKRGIKRVVEHMLGTQPPLAMVHENGLLTRGRPFDDADSDPFAT